MEPPRGESAIGEQDTSMCEQEGRNAPTAPSLVDATEGEAVVDGDGKKSQSTTSPTIDLVGLPFTKTPSTLSQVEIVWLTPPS